jgi:hypothetical protein
VFSGACLQAGHGNGPEYAQWVVEQAVVIWEKFSRKFLSLWQSPTLHKGELFKRWGIQSRTTADARCGP